MNSRRDKRKVQDTSLEEDIEHRELIFQKSKLVTRSPVKTEETREMEAPFVEQILKELREMRSDMAKGFKECNEQNEKLRKEVENTNREIQQIKQEMKNKERIWQSEKQELKGKIIELEEKWRPRRNRREETTL